MRRAVSDAWSLHLNAIDCGSWGEITRISWILNRYCETESWKHCVQIMFERRHRFPKSKKRRLRIYCLFSISISHAWTTQAKMPQKENARHKHVLSWPQWHFGIRLWSNKNELAAVVRNWRFVLIMTTHQFGEILEILGVAAYLTSGMFWKVTDHFDFPVF